MHPGNNYRQLWVFLGLTVLLCMAAVSLAVSPALARYRAEREETISFQVREPEQICLGVERTVTAAEAAADESLKEGDPIFDGSQEPRWVTTDDVPRLTMAVANGVSKTDFSRRDQKIRLRLIGGAGFWTGDSTPKVELRVPSDTAQAGYDTIQASVSRIETGTVLYNTYGEGWILTFLEGEDQEVSWTLEGGKLSYVTITLAMEDVTLSENTLLQPQIIAEVING